MSTCTLCGQQGHKASRCKELNPPNPDEFFSGGGGGGGHSHDDDDENITINKQQMKYLHHIIKILNQRQSRKTFLP